MHITASAVQLKAEHRRASAQLTRVEVRPLPPVAPPQRPVSDPIGLSQRARALQAEREAQAADPLCPKDCDDEPLTDADLEVLRLLLRRLTGQPLRLLRPEDLQLDEEAARALSELSAAARPVEPGRIVRETTVKIEQEQLEVQIQGSVQTDDGQTLQLKLRLQMSREQWKRQHTETRIEPAPKDPLVLDLGRVEGLLSGATLDLDLDFDGEADALPVLGEGSVYLVHDRDGDGLVSDASELFGPRSGDGFSELAALDDDQNGFLDAADAAWSRLRVWSGDRLLALGVVGVGAVYTGAVEAPFTLTDPAGERMAEQRSVGFWIGEGGASVGTVRRLDVVA